MCRCYQIASMVFSFHLDQFCFLWVKCLQTPKSCALVWAALQFIVSAPAWLVAPCKSSSILQSTWQYPLHFGLSACIQSCLLCHICSLSRCVLVHDDLELELGKWQFRLSGSARLLLYCCSIENSPLRLLIAVTSESSSLQLLTLLLLELIAVHCVHKVLRCFEITLLVAQESRSIT